MRTILETAAAGVLVVVIVALATVAWQRATDGSLIELLGGATGEQMTELTERVGDLAEQVDDLTTNAIQELFIVERSVQQGVDPDMECNPGWRPTIRFHESYRDGNQNMEKHSLICAR